MNPTRPPPSPHPLRAYPSDDRHVNSAAHRGPLDESTPSFYPSHLAQYASLPRPPLPAGHSGLPALPPSLMPGSRARARTSETLGSFESSLFFQQTAPPPMPTPMISPTNYVAHPYALSPPSFDRPLVPPKPHLWTSTSAGTSRQTRPEIPPKSFSEPGHSFAPLMTPQTPLSPEDSDELVARALELSIQDTGPAGWSEADDDILARVIEESMASIDATTTQGLTSTSSQLLTTDTIVEPLSASSSSPSSTSFSSPGFTETPASSDYSHSFENDRVVKGKERLSGEINLEELDKQELEMIMLEDELRRKQLAMDEELARSIAREEASPSPKRPLLHSLPSSSSSSSDAGTDTSSLPINRNSRPPSYQYSLTSGRSSSFSSSSTPRRLSPDSHTSFVTTNGYGSRPLPPKGVASPAQSSSIVGSASALDKLGRSASAQAALPSPMESDTNRGAAEAKWLPQVLNSTRLNTVIPAQGLHDSSSPEASPSSPKVKPKTSLNDFSRVSASGSIAATSPSIEETPENVSESDQSSVSSPTEQDEGQLVSTDRPSSAPMVEDDLLMGVSFGFNAPSLSIAHLPMQGPIPNIITLPYGKSPPLHIQAPNWKQLLKLLTRLSESRIEPTVEALAGAKSELRLRTVLQFVKVHHASNDWLTIVYLSIDVPVPPQVPNAFKYTNGDVSTFPYSYVSSPLPALLRAGAGDSDLAKCFTVPATANAPYPKLPLALPDYAMYLHSVLEASRRAASDSSGGLRRLAKMVDGFYPQVAGSRDGLGTDVDLPGRRGVGGFFRRALGKGEKTQTQRGGNADTYEFITPFRIDEYR